MKKLLIRNARLVNEGSIVESDLLVAGERIERIAGTIEAGSGVRVVDAAGRYLIPGMIDDQVHFREPGLTAKGDLASESRAAVAGGVTSFMDMPNVNPQTTTRAALAAKYELAKGRCPANHAFYLGATNRNIEEIKALRVGEACGIKAFMGASTGDMLVDDPTALESLFEHAPVIVVTHCEDSPTIWENEAAARRKYGDAVPMREHPVIRSAAACLKSSRLATGLARRHDALLHVLHLTTAREMELFSAGHRRDKRITAEVCVHHLWFDESDYEEHGTRIKCNPAIKTRADRQGLLTALKADRLDIIATDHAPHTATEKNNDYFQAPAGLPLVQHVLQCLFDLAEQGHFSVERLVDKTSHAVADIFGVKDRGYLREGYYADLALVNPQNPYTVQPSNILYKVGWSPFEGHTFGSTVDMTIVNGEVVWQDGELTGAIPGQRMQFERAR